MVIPDAECLEPKATKDDWQPLVMVDTSDPSTGAVVTVTEPSASLDVGRVQLQLRHEPKRGVVETLGGVVLNFAAVGEKSDAKNGSRKSGYAFKGLKRGKYFVTVSFLDRNIKKTVQHCHRNVIAYFWLVTDDHYTAAYRQGLFQNWSVKVGLAVLVASVVGFAVALIVILCLRWRQKRRNEAGARVISFSDTPKVLILYTDDSYAHRDCVLRLASFLQNEGRCDVLIDEWALATSGLAPDQWLFHAMDYADFYLIVFSEGSKLAFQGEELLPRRHWMELFNPGVTFVLQEMLNDCRKRSPLHAEPLAPYIWIRFDYSDSDCVEPFLNRLPVSKYVLPTDLNRLLCHLHTVPFNNVQFEMGARREAETVRLSVVAASEFHREHPDWLNERRGRAANGAAETNGQLAPSTRKLTADLAAVLRNLGRRGDGENNVVLNVGESFAKYSKAQGNPAVGTCNSNSGGESSLNFGATNNVENLSSSNYSGPQLTSNSGEVTSSTFTDASAGNSSRGNTSDWGDTRTSEIPNGRRTLLPERKEQTGDRKSKSFQLYPPEERDEGSRQPLVPKYEVIGSPDDDSDTEAL